MEGGGLGDFITVMWLMMVDTQGVAANKEPRGPSCNILSKDLRLECSNRNSSVNTACCSVELWPKPPNFLLSVYLMSSHVMKFPRPSPSGFCTIEVIKIGGGNGLGMRLACTGFWYEILLSDFVDSSTSSVLGTTLPITLNLSISISVAMCL